MGDNIKKPDHYCEGRKYEPKDVIRDWGLNFNLGSAVKYISRAGRKGDKLEDLKKAKQFLHFEIEGSEEDEDLKWIVQKIDNNEVTADDIPSDLYHGYRDIRDAVERKTSWYTNGILGHWYYYQNIPDGYKARVIDKIAQEVLDSQIIPPDEVRAAVIDRIVERINNGELDLMDISDDLYDECVRRRSSIANSEYHKAMDALRKYAEKGFKKVKEIDDEDIVRCYADDLLKEIVNMDTVPNKYKDRVIEYIVEMIDSGKLSFRDIPWRLFAYSMKIRNAVYKKYHGDTTFTMSDTITYSFNFEED